MLAISDSRLDVESSDIRLLCRPKNITANMTTHDTNPRSSNDGMNIMLMKIKPRN